eukprot:COSAG02_NODE_2065_length_9961_cov_37.811397_6_plen_52_part_00
MPVAAGQQRQRSELWSMYSDSLRVHHQRNGMHCICRGLDFMRVDQLVHYLI